MKTVIFDFDGTIADTFHIFMRILNEVPRFFGIHRIAQSEIDRVRMMTGKDALKYFGVSMWKLLPFLYYFRNAQSKYVDQITLFPEVMKQLNLLHATGEYTFHIVSTNALETIHGVLDRADCSLFQTVHSENSMFHKERILAKVAATLGLRPSQILYVADELRDYEACSRGNIPFLGVTWGFNSAESFKARGARNIAITPKSLAEQVAQMAINVT